MTNYRENVISIGTEGDCSSMAKKYHFLENNLGKVFHFEDLTAPKRFSILEYAFSISISAL